MKAIIMAGGKGTRVAGLTKNQIPKPMLRIGGRPILEWQLLQMKKYGITEVTMVTGYLGEVIRDYFGDGSSLGMHIGYIEEKEPLGTAGALYYFRESRSGVLGVAGTGAPPGTEDMPGCGAPSDTNAAKLCSAHSDTNAAKLCSASSDTNAAKLCGAFSETAAESACTATSGNAGAQDGYFFCMGDIFFDYDISRMKKFHDEKGAFITLLAHPNMHPQDSDLVVVDKDNRVTAFDSKHNVKDYWFDNLVNAGIFIFTPAVPELVKEPVRLSLEKELIAPVLGEKKVYAYVTPEYVRDVGTPDRIAGAQEDLGSGLVAARNLERKQKAIFLDRDGTINRFNGFVGSPEGFTLLDNAAEAIRRINRSGYLAVVVTNQPVIARGEATVQQVEEIHRKLKTLLGREGCYIDDIIYCPHHPDRGFEREVPELKIDCSCRKPKTGMVEEAARRWNIDLAQSWVIGDGTIDIEMGRRAGCRTVLVETGQAGRDGKCEVTPDHEAEDILGAVKYILE